MTQTCLICIKNSNFVQLCKIGDLDLLSIYIGSIIHDYKHPGLNNGFLINTGHEIATRYNDISVLENFHISEAFAVIRSDPSYDIFSLLSKDEKKSLRKKIVECVLSTDMTSHARYFTMIKLKVERYDIKNGKNADLIFSGSNASDGLPQLQQDFCSLILHFSDIANPAKPFDVYKHWMNTVMEEFFLQGDKEKSLGMPPSFLCDRETVTIEGSQIGFIDGIVLPFAIPIIEIFPDLDFFTNNLKENKEILKHMKEAKEIVKQKEKEEKERLEKMKESNREAQEKANTPTSISKKEKTIDFIKKSSKVIENIPEKQAEKIQTKEDLANNNQTELEKEEEDNQKENSTTDNSYLYKKKISCDPPLVKVDCTKQI